jgi:hypothetical protein
MSFLATMRAAMQPEQDEIDAVTVAAAAARIEGVQAATNRFSAILSADGVKGDAALMDAAIDLAMKSPGMSADEIVSHVRTLPAASDRAVQAKAGWDEAFDTAIGAVASGFRVSAD